MIKSILLTIIILFSIISVPLNTSITSAATNNYTQITTSNQSLSDAVFATGPPTDTMDVKWLNGKLHIYDSNHTTRNLKIKNTRLEAQLDGYNGKEVMLYHVNDAGVKDSSRLVPIQSDSTWTYFYDVEFSEVIIDGFVGTWEVTAYNLSVSDSLNFGQTFNASNVTSLSVNVTDDATKAHPYDINTTGLVGWWKLDDDYIDSSGNGNNGTAHGDTHFVNGKYNNGTVFDGVDDYIDCGNDTSLNVSYAYTLSAWIKNPNSTGDDRSIFGKDDSGNERIFQFRIDNGAGVLRFIRFDNSNSVITNIASSNIVDNNHLHYVVAVFDNTSGSKIYIDGEIDGSDDVLTDNNIGTENLLIGARISIGLSDRFNGFIDNAHIYNRALSATEIETHYYDHLQQLKIKTNSNSTWSDEWNSTADNPIQVIYGAGELITLLNFTVPDTVVQNEITIYDYPPTVQFDAVATVGYTEGTTKIEESAAAGTYTLNITHAAGNTGEGYINYTTTNAVLLDADFWNSANLSTDNPNATLSSTLPYFNISTGYVPATTEYYYLITQDYFHPPTNLVGINGTDNISLNWDDMPNSDNYSVYKDDAFLRNVTASNYTVTGLTPATEYNLSVTTWNGSQQSNKAFVLATTNYTLIKVTNLTITPSTIKESQTSTVTVDANETSGSISAVTVTIGGSTYLMSATTGDTWSYTWTAPQNAPHKYFITQIAATGLYSTNTTIQTAYIDVLSSTGTGGAGGLPIDIVDEPIEDEIETIPQKPSPDEVIQTTLTNITESIKDIFKSDQLDFVTIKIIHGDHVMVREFASKNAYQCDSTDPQITCGVIDNTITLIVNPVINDSTPLQIIQTHIAISDRDGKIHHVPISITVINLLWYVDFNLNIGVNNPYIVDVDPQTGETTGLRMWWVTAIVGLAALGFMRKYN